SEGKNTGMDAIGNLNCKAAVFVYKKDGSAGKIWSEVKQRFYEEKSKGGESQNFDPFHAEWHDTRSGFLESLKTWNTEGDLRNSFLCINCHAARQELVVLEQMRRLRISQKVLSPGVNWLRICLIPLITYGYLDAPQ